VHLTNFVNDGWELIFYTTHADASGILHNMIWRREGEPEHFEPEQVEVAAQPERPAARTVSFTEALSRAVGGGKP
jgi:hypothetical protein